MPRRRAKQETVMLAFEEVEVLSEPSGRIQLSDADLEFEDDDDEAPTTVWMPPRRPSRRPAPRQANITWWEAARDGVRVEAPTPVRRPQGGRLSWWEAARLGLRSDER